MDKILQSVALLLFDRSKTRIFTIEELQEKPNLQKRKGDWSFPWETINPDENKEAALERLLSEEVAEDKKRRVFSCPEFVGTVTIKFALCVAEVHIYCARLSANDGFDENLLIGSDAGVEFQPLGFVTLDELIRKGRHGVRDVLRVAATLQEIGC